MTRPSDPARWCTATARSTGVRCGNPAIRGGTVCLKHGGAAPQVRAAARLRLATLVEPALGRLARILATGNDRDAIRAIENVLDRAGVPRGGAPDDDEARVLLAEYLIDLRDRAALDGDTDDDDDADDPESDA